jgi:hypothetical protein
MSGSPIRGAGDADDRRQWAYLDSSNERLLDASDPLMLDLYRDRGREPDDTARKLPAAS